ncbi:uncharacterized protein GGS22DRAFT_67540 [Annulohypoxylon maeteangense]|uniref:uncharacterized protein n=1 Tax=Annulohypoxylon maeteangense TaxID=1927788 RepID=UPI0020085414|nr:uncharacterized protein GGS22DRAFT_67540 [Annulohypoxylon maeteangense]KAI0889117.1 hypothetical protein GGS22DRAFT_67540 [Annulohypoxylon maeteangense]
MSYLVFSLITQSQLLQLHTSHLTHQQLSLYDTSNFNSIKMQFLTLAAFIATASAADVIFKVTDFSAGCIRHSTQCSYNFNVIQPGTMETTGVACSAMLAANTDGTLPDVKDGTCKDSARTFSVTKGADGLTLTVTQPVTPSSDQSGSHLLANADLKMSNEPNAVVQTYTGISGFDLTS